MIHKQLGNIFHEEHLPKKLIKNINFMPLIRHLISQKILTLIIPKTCISKFTFVIFVSLIGKVYPLYISKFSKEILNKNSALLNRLHL